GHVLEALLEGPAGERVPFKLKSFAQAPPVVVGGRARLMATQGPGLYQLLVDFPVAGGYYSRTTIRIKIQ
ncbi:MAG: hypothetical protein D6715_12765, partial [Calditrichaeota bacterium]